MSDAIQAEATERREGHRTLSLQMEEVRSEVATVKTDVATVRSEVGTVKAELDKVAKGLRILRRKATRDVAALTEELAKLNRRALAIALAAVLAALGSIPEARAMGLALAKGLMH